MYKGAERKTEPGRNRGRIGRNWARTELEQAEIGQNRGGVKMEPGRNWGRAGRNGRWSRGGTGAEQAGTEAGAGPEPGKNRGGMEAGASQSRAGLRRNRNRGKRNRHYHKGTGR